MINFAIGWLEAHSAVSCISTGSRRHGWRAASQLSRFPGRGEFFYATVDRFPVDPDIGEQIRGQFQSSYASQSFLGTDVPSIDSPG